MKESIILSNRAVISISGEDREIFLQGLITNDIKKCGENQAIYSLMLSPQGRFLYDFFIIKDDQKFLIDCEQSKVDEIVQKLNFYKLRSKVEIKKEPNLIIIAGFDKEIFDNQSLIFADPRNSEMGFRGIVESEDSQQAKTNLDQYNFHRINLKIPDHLDLTFDQSFPLEFGFDNLNCVDYQKGCYVGQETTARMHYKGVIRKKIFLVKLAGNKIEKSTSIDFENKTIGQILSSVLYQNQLFALALIKNFDNEAKTNEGQEIDFTKPNQEKALKANNQELIIIR